MKRTSESSLPRAPSMIMLRINHFTIPRVISGMSTPSIILSGTIWIQRKHSTILHVISLERMAYNSGSLAIASSSRKQRPLYVLLTLSGGMVNLLPLKWRGVLANVPTGKGYIGIKTNSTTRGRRPHQTENNGQYRAQKSLMLRALRKTRSPTASMLSRSSVQTSMTTNMDHRAKSQIISPLHKDTRWLQSKLRKWMIKKRERNSNELIRTVSRRPEVSAASAFLPYLARWWDARWMWV